MSCQCSCRCALIRHGVALVLAVAGVVCIWKGLDKPLVDLLVTGPVAFLETTEGGAERAHALKIVIVIAAVLVGLRARSLATLVAGGAAGLLGSSIWGIVKSCLDDLEAMKSSRSMAATAQKLQDTLQIGPGLWLCGVGIALLLAAPFVAPGRWKRCDSPTPPVPPPAGGS